MMVVVVREAYGSHPDKVIACPNGHVQTKLAEHYPGLVFDPRETAFDWDERAYLYDACRVEGA